MNRTYQTFITCALFSLSPLWLTACANKHKSVLDTTSQEYFEAYKKRTISMYQGEDQQKYGIRSAGRLEPLSEMQGKIFSAFIESAQTIQDIEIYRIARAWSIYNKTTGDFKSREKRSAAISHIIKWNKQQSPQPENIRARDFPRPAQASRQVGELPRSGGSARLRELLREK
jgi:hypothetical protein